MAYRIGIEVGPEHTTWATVSRDGGGPERIDGGTLESVAGTRDGTLVAGVDAAELGDVHDLTRGFVERLGESDAIIIGGTPYGVETLVGGLIASAVRVATARQGSPPGAVVLVHDDSLDEYRVGLLVEAARVAGVPVADVETATRRDAGAAIPASGVPAGLATVVGASLVGWARRPAPVAAAGGVGAAEVGLAATGAAGAAAGGAAVAGTAMGEGVASASAAMASPAVAGSAGTPVGAGPAGTPISTPPAGPAGTPLSTPAGPTGTPLSPTAGPTGTPLTPASGPSGTPLPGPAVGAAGTPLEPVATPGSGGLPGVLKRPRKLPMIIGAGVAAVAVATVVVVAAGGDDSPSTAPATTVLVEPGVTTAPTDAPGTTAAPVDSTVPAVVPDAAACVQGGWTMRNESFAEFFSSMMAGAGAGELALTGVSGSVAIDVAEDGTWTITYSDWTITAAAAATSAVISISIDGVDVSSGTFKDDGTYSFSGVSVGSTMTSTATVDGVDVPIPPIDRSSQVIDGTGTFTCAGDELTLTVPESAGSFTMDRDR